MKYPLLLSLVAFCFHVSSAVSDTPVAGEDSEPGEPLRGKARFSQPLEAEPKPEGSWVDGWVNSWHQEPEGWSQEQEEEWLRLRRQHEARLETALYSQQRLLAEQFERLVAQTPGEVEAYAVLAALTDSETVFRSEVEIIDAQLSAIPAFENRVVALANELHDESNFPLANGSSLRKTLRDLGERLGAEDLLLVYLTSHGYPDHALVVQYGGVSLPALAAEELAEVLAEAPQRKVVVISACYSGGFIPVLEDEDTFVITAAAADRPSFGCSNEETMTYFGNAFFRQAFTLNKPLDEVFTDALQAVTQREEEEGMKPSKPQIGMAEPVLDAWEQWRLDSK